MNHTTKLVLFTIILVIVIRLGCKLLLGCAIAYNHFRGGKYRL